MSTLTAILKLIDLATGESSSGGFSNWGEVADFNFGRLEATVGEVTSKTLAAIDITLSEAEEASLLIKLDGTLGANVAVNTSGRKGFWFVRNGTTGAFTVTFKPTAGVGVVIPQGGSAILVCDGTNTLDMASALLTQPTLILKQGTAPTPTAEGDLQWDTDDNHFVVGDGAAGRKIGKVTVPQIKSTPGAFVYTPTPGARFADFEMVGGGGAGGNVDGQAGSTGAAAGGGASGFYGRTGPIDITGAATFNGTIGAAGTVSGSSFGDGGNGGNTSITVGATTYTAGGGGGGGGMIASTTEGGSQDGGAPGVGTNLVGYSAPGEIGVYNGNTATNGTGGNGASSPFGSGGKGGHVITTSAGLNGGAAAGFGAGGAGAVIIQSTANTVGSAGTAGYMRITEYY